VGKFQKERLWAEEIVAELSAQVICQLVGKRMDGALGNSYRYIERYAKVVGLSPITACLKVIDEVEKVLSLILGKDKRTEEWAIEGNSAIEDPPSWQKGDSPGDGQPATTMVSGSGT
jgi:antirestriction protein ArdC